MSDLKSTNETIAKMEARLPAERELMADVTAPREKTMPNTDEDRLSTGKQIQALAKNIEPRYPEAAGLLYILAGALVGRIEDRLFRDVSHYGALIKLVVGMVKR